MRVLQLFAYGIFASSVANAASIPENDALSILEAHGGSSLRSADILSPDNTLEKRKGGGGKGGGGGGGGGGGKSGGGGSARTGPGSNAGGATKSGSGPARAYGGGFYGGGASTPYQAGQKTPKGFTPGLLLFPAAALLIFPAGLWLYGVYPYALNNYRFYNETYQNATQRGLNQTLPVTCLCQQYSVCGCEQNDNQQYLNDLVGNGSYQALNKSVVTVADLNGTTTLVLNGTLPNGTTAPGGVDDAGVSLKVGQYSGYWLMGLIAIYAAVLL